MGDPNAPALSSELILRELDRCLVDYVIVGGFAATIYGPQGSRPISTWWLGAHRPIDGNTSALAFRLQKTHTSRYAEYDYGSVS